MPHTGPFPSSKRAIIWPKFGIGVPFAARSFRPARDIGDGLTGPGEMFGGVTKSYAPESTTASMR